MRRVLLAELITRGVRLEPHQAVAIVQQLIRCGAVSPTPHNVRLGTDGSVECVGCDTTPAVYEIAILLQVLLPPERVGVPGGLRYAIARGLHEVDARPFDSIAELSAALSRFENGDRRAVVARLVRPLVPAAAAATPAIVAVDDLVVAPAAAGYGLREASDEVAVIVPPGIADGAAGGARRWRTALGVAAALVLCALSGYTAVRLMGHPDPAVANSAASGAREAPPVSHAEPSNIASLAPANSATAEATPPAAAQPPQRVSPPAIEPIRTPELKPAIAAATPGNEFSPAFASDGSAMFFHTGGSRDARSAIMATGEYGLEVMTIVDDGSRNYHVRPSPNGEMIAFDSDRDGVRGIYVARRDGSDVRRVSGAGYAAVPSWSPDGRRLAYIRAEPGDARVWNLWIQSLDDGRETALTKYRYGQTWGASWFPDGRRVCYSHEDQLVIADLDSGRRQVIESPLKGRLVRTPAVSPDGTRVIFQVFRSGAWLYTVADGSTQFVLTDPTAEEFAWAPDSRHVAFHSRRDGAWGIYVIAE